MTLGINVASSGVRITKRILKRHVEVSPWSGVTHAQLNELNLWCKVLWLREETQRFAVVDLAASG